MTRTVTALFDNRSDAEAAEARLKAANVDATHISIHDNTTSGFHATGHSTTNEPGIWASIKNAFLPDEDRHTYEEGVRRGGVLLTADVDEDHVDAVVRVLEEADTVDIDERADEWRSSGWDYAPETPEGTVAGERTAGDTASGLDKSNASDAALRGTDMAGEQAIPVVQGELVAGKREVDRGGARVRSYVTEIPVHEQVRLRSERINVQRRAVDRPLADADNAFRERTIDAAATGEEAVVGRTARAVEEFVVSKTTDERAEQIDEGILHTGVNYGRRSSAARVSRSGSQSRLDYIGPAATVTIGDIEHSLKVARVVESASDVFGSREEAMSFLQRPAIALEQRRPIDLLSTAEGIKIVEDHLERVRYGVYS